MYTLLLPVESTISPSTKFLLSTLIRRLRRDDRDIVILNVSLYSTMLSLYTVIFGDLIISPGLNVTLIALELKSEVSKMQKYASKNRN